MAGMGGMFDMAQLMMAVGQNPQLASLLDGLGVPAPTGQLGDPAAPGISTGGSLGSMLTGPSMIPGAPQLGAAAPDAAAGAPAPGAGAGTPGATDPMKALLGLQGIAKPAAVTPIMHGGVTGGVKPPTATVGTGVPSALQMMLQAAQAGKAGAGPEVPGLGSILRGGRY